MFNEKDCTNYRHSVYNHDIEAEIMIGQRLHARSLEEPIQKLEGELAAK